MSRVVLCYELQQNFEEEYLQVYRYLSGRFGIDFHEDADVLLEGNEVDLELVEILEEIVDVKQFLR
jgi:hypothetical protein